MHNINDINRAARKVKDGERLVGRATGDGVEYVIQTVRSGRAVSERPETNDERYAREAKVQGTQAWAETRGDDLGESPDY